ncbi:23S rRNA (uracil(1939)-C(5))-methyltransferase RlmD [Niallia sp. MER TA 168]|uniref:23S rRNA (uracil(1939)-C(5))-methyltransferase RlmD n=1 Tax=Niallia sp. MER TA 168 TaxID=2939568 RepID=UPI002040C947|nr:23S rRNA (uracil(1939)-C(5))-methyltransferase RlmD [Niallia sp. MER TA 168]MCM3361281.1 23S rRNA (uracil(1939)-C(5))-methyltransferase RlmD [Niallia sp. MER TA 168]
MSKTLPVQKNDIIDIVFEDLTHDGSGVAKVDGYPLFIPNGLPGEKAKVKVIKTNKNYGFGRLMEITERSPYRVEAPCLIYKECGGCQLQHLSYEGQLKTKHKHVKDVLERIGKIDTTVHPTLGMENPWRYRNKSQVPIGEQEGGLIGGFYQQRSHQIINMEQCMIQQEENDYVVNTVKAICSKYGVRAYDEARHKGELRHIMARRGLVTKEVMVVLITRTQDIPNRKAIVDEIVQKVPNIKSIIHNVNNKKTNVIMGDITRTIWGEETITDYIGDVKFAISARSFYQVNPEQTKVLYEKALEYANLNGEEKVIDAYCGIGTISLFLAKKASQVFGVEIVPQAIEDARNNARLNDIHNVEFAVGEAEVVIPNWYKEGNEADVLVVDPPRKGCDEALLQTILDMKPKKVVYVSCNPATLARDLRILEDGGYKTEEVQPVDMFPQTMHVECISQLILKEGN